MLLLLVLVFVDGVGEDTDLFFPMWSYSNCCQCCCCWFLKFLLPVVAPATAIRLATVGNKVSWVFGYEHL